MKTIWFALKLAVFAAALALATIVQASDQLTVLHGFQGSPGTGDPAFQLIADAAGNLYGTTFWGGDFKGCNGLGCGVVYRLTPQGNKWVYSVLYRFPGDKGSEPTKLIVDSTGNLYGELTAGGVHANGSVFELSPTSSGPWKYSDLYDFTGQADGGFPSGGLAFDKIGNLYGAAVFGGTPNCDPLSNACGAVFELSPNAGGGWTETVLHSFTFATSKGGFHPLSNLVFDAAGNLYGTTSSGGNLSVCTNSITLGCGVIYQLKSGSGGWTFSTIYTFSGGSDGGEPDAGVTFDAEGNLFGTTSAEAAGFGTVFELSPSSTQGWTFNLVYTFLGKRDGGGTLFPVTLDSSGNVYGSAFGGVHGSGVAFELSATSSGWSYSLLHTFTGGADGQNPNGLILDGAGNLYGVANYGGKAGCINQGGCGTAFKLSPVASVDPR